MEIHKRNCPHCNNEISYSTKQTKTNAEIANQFLHINNQAPAFNQAGAYFKGIKIVKA